MKTKQILLFATSLGILLSACGSSAQPTVTQFPESMKGYELYSWRDGTQWNFSLLAGTNREKSLSEIKSADITLPGIGALRTTLEKIPAGQYVTWAAKESLSFPPNEIIQQVEQICEDRGLILSIAE